MYLSHCADAPCGSALLESSARYQLLELHVDISGTPSVALIYSGASHSFADESLVKTALLTLF